MMPIDDAIVYHSKELTKANKELLAGYGDAPLTISTTFRMVEIEVPVLQLEIA